MATLLEMANNIVSAHAQTTPMTTAEILAEIQKVHSVLQALDAGVSTSQEGIIEEPAAPTLTLKQAFRTNEVVCIICGKGMKSLARHLTTVHQMKPSEYRKQFNIPKTQKLMSKVCAAKRKEVAATMDLVGNLEKARAARMGNMAVAKANVPVVKTKAPVPAVRVKAPVPVVKKKAGVPVKAEKKK